LSVRRTVGRGLAQFSANWVFWPIDLQAENLCLTPSAPLFTPFYCGWYPMTQQKVFHVNVFARPFACTWEEGAAALERLPRMLFEPDGSFVVSGGMGPTRWQVDGHLFDFDDRLYRIELHGHCPMNALDELLSCVGWPEVELAFEMVREGVTLNEEAFRLSVWQVLPD